jgi:hypothetical protein
LPDTGSSFSFDCAKFALISPQLFSNWLSGSGRLNAALNSHQRPAKNRYHQRSRGKELKRGTELKMGFLSRDVSVKWKGPAAAEEFRE